jgi:hypothetical protein
MKQIPALVQLEAGLTIQITQVLQYLFTFIEVIVLSLEEL